MTCGALGGKITDLHNALSPESLDVAAAARLIDTMEKYEVDIPIYGDRPLLHHALNLYFISPDPQDRAALVALMRDLIEKHIDINAPYNSDPDVVFKAVVIRELGLAHAMAGGGGLTNHSVSLTQLYSVPCDPVPLSKLLLSAHSVVQKHRAQADMLAGSAARPGSSQPFSLDEVKALLSGRVWRHPRCSSCC